MWLPPELWEQVSNGGWVPADFVPTPNAQDETPRAAPYTPKPEIRVLNEPPEVTWAWGENYPCCGYNLQTGMKCGGIMERKGRRFRFERRGRLWNRFVCRRCGRRADDWAQET